MNKPFYAIVVGTIVLAMAISASAVNVDMDDTNGPVFKGRLVDKHLRFSGVSAKIVRFYMVTAGNTGLPGALTIDLKDIYVEDTGSDIKIDYFKGGPSDYPSYFVTCWAENDYLPSEFQITMSFEALEYGITDIRIEDIYFSDAGRNMSLYTTPVESEIEVNFGVDFWCSLGPWSIYPDGSCKISLTCSGTGLQIANRICFLLNYDPEDMMFDSVTWGGYWGGETWDNYVYYFSYLLEPGLVLCYACFHSSPSYLNIEMNFKLIKPEARSLSVAPLWFYNFVDGMWVEEKEKLEK